jgi:hypothetical protein
MSASASSSASDRIVRSATKAAVISTRPALRLALPNAD